MGTHDILRCGVTCIHVDFTDFFLLNNLRYSTLIIGLYSNGSCISDGIITFAHMFQLHTALQASLNVPCCNGAATTTEK